ncbi:MAG: hypothetical protein V4498_05550 [candidate division FCPU426 bacterium]
MATRSRALQYIRTLARQKTVTRDELLKAFDSGLGEELEEVPVHKLGVAEILYYLGGGIVFFGIAILLGQNWSTLSFETKFLATFGSGIASYVVGLIFSRDARTESVSSAFHLISALATPLGLWVVFDHAGFDANSYGIQCLISGAMLGSHLLSLAVFKKNLFIVFSILFGAWLFFSLTSWMVGGAALFRDWKFYMYRVLAAGTSFMLIGYAFSKNKRRAPLSGFFYSFGVFGFLAAALALGGWNHDKNVFWELVYPGLIFAILFLSVHTKAKAFLYWGTFFLMAYILKITSEHFSTGLGWPLALVIAGLAMIAAGYMALSIKKKYLYSE